MWMQMAINTLITREQLAWQRWEPFGMTLIRRAKQYEGLASALQGTMKKPATGGSASSRAARLNIKPLVVVICHLEVRGDVCVPWRWPQF